MSDSVRIDSGSSVLKITGVGGGSFSIECVAYPVESFNSSTDLDVDSPDFQMGIVMSGLIGMLTTDMDYLINKGMEFIDAGHGPYTRILDGGVDTDILTEDQLNLFRMAPKGEA